jgi:hypothetical protein
MFESIEPDDGIKFNVATFIGVGINLLMMYVAAREIRRMQKLIRLSTQNRPDTE